MNKELIITFSLYGIGGAQRRAFSLANQFAENGYLVYIVAVLGDDKTINNENYYYTHPNVNIIIIPEYYQKHRFDALTIKSDKHIEEHLKYLKKVQHIVQPFKKALEKINYRIKAVKTTNDLRSFFMSHQDALIINFGFNIFDKVFFSAKGLGFKIIYSETNASNKYSSDRYCEQTKKTIKKADALIFQTTEEKAEHGITKSKKAFVIHNPIKSDLPQSYNKSRNKTIVNFCRLSRQKNLLLLIKAFEKLLVDYPDYKLKIYADTADSKNTEYKEELISYIATNKLENSVFILPPSPDIHSIILDCAMFVSSSDYEGISNSMIEAMAIGLPCVCTDCGGGGAREMINDGENGLLVPVGDADALKNAMVRMITEKDLAEKCSKNAAKIRETHSIEKISEKWLEVINNI